MSYYLFEKFRNACCEALGNVILINPVPRTAEQDFNLRTRKEVLNFICNNGLEELESVNKKMCPVCGSGNLDEEFSQIAIKEPFAEEEIVKVKEYSCPVCNSTGDLFNENDAIIEEAHLRLRQKSVENILNDFLQHKVSMSSLERALGLPQRTLTKWKNELANPSASGVALLRFLRLFPWLIEAAENHFDYDTAKKIHIQAAVSQFLSKINFTEDTSIEATVVRSKKAALFYFESSDKENEDATLTYPDVTTNPPTVQENKVFYM